MSNLIDNKSVQPIGGILSLFKRPKEVEFVRKCFRELFSEDGGDIDARQERIESFMDKINRRIDQYESGSWKYPQNMKDVIYYLNLWRPYENYIFKSTEASDWANCVEYGDDFGSGKSFSLKKYYRMCDELLEEVKKNDAILELHKARFDREAQGVFDDKLHILVYDIIYCAHAYNFYEYATIHTTSAKERIRHAALREQYEEARSRYNAATEARDNIAAQATLTVDLTGKKLKHKTYGIGTVKSHANGTLIIEFGVGTKKFQYPNAIKGGFLSAVDDEVASGIQHEKDSKTELENAEKELSLAKDEYENLKRAMGIKG
ncbi:MAG: hypothetical protein LUF92_05450 [Clostridiales bacterium]|nr:hypothetical protein [Clostridiales bacterium]